jgi:hypothetical protein
MFDFFKIRPSLTTSKSGLGTQNIHYLTTKMELLFLVVNMRKPKLIKVTEGINGASSGSFHEEGSPFLPGWKNSLRQFSWATKRTDSGQHAVEILMQITSFSKQGHMSDRSMKIILYPELNHL